MLDAIDITKQFGAKLALDKVSLSVSPGDIYCLLGANGAGKTTLINLFLNFLQPAACRSASWMSHKTRWRQNSCSPTSPNR